MVSSNRVKVAGFEIFDMVEITSDRLGLCKVKGRVTGFASGKGLTPYIRVRHHGRSIGDPAESPWCRASELTPLATIN